MKKQFTIKFSLILASLSLFLLNNSNAQCSYVTDKAIDGQKIAATTIPIPCNFPIFENNGNGQSDKMVFEVHVAEFKLLHPELHNVLFFPEATPVAEGTYFNISKAEYELLSPAKQKTIKTLEGFYRINP